MASRVVVCNLVLSFSFSRYPYRDNVSLVSDQPLGNDPCARSRFVDRELIETWKDRSIFCRKKWSAPWIDCPPASRGSRITRNVGNIVRFWNRKGGRGWSKSWIELSIRTGAVEERLYRILSDIISRFIRFPRSVPKSLCHWFQVRRKIHRFCEKRSPVGTDLNNIARADCPYPGEIIAHLRLCFSLE